MLVIAFHTCEGTILDDDFRLGAKLDLSWQEILTLFFGNIDIELHEVGHLLVGHDDGLVFAFLWLHLKLELGIVLLLEEAHLGLAGFDEEEIAHHGTITDHAAAQLLSHHALVALEGNECFYVFHFFEQLFNGHLPAIRGTHGIPLKGFLG